MSNPSCENCPEKYFGEWRGTLIASKEQNIDLIKRDLAQCALQHILSGHRAELKRKLAFQEKLLRAYQAIEPTLEVMQDCDGPFVRIVEDERGDWEQKICGARVTDHVTGMRIESVD